MNERQHAYLARALQDACGGADTCLTILEASPFKMGRTHVYDTRDPSTGRTMPIGAVGLLEQVCGRRVYSEVLFAQAAEPTEAQCAVSEACELSETASQLQRKVRKAGEDDVFTEHEKREIEPTLQLLERHVRGVRAAMDAAPCSAGKPPVFVGVDLGRAEAFAASDLKARS